MHSKRRALSVVLLLLVATAACGGRPEAARETPRPVVTPRLAPANGPSPALRFVVISDSNDRYGSEAQGIGVERAVRRIVDAIAPAFVIHNGDLIAGQSRRLGPERIERMWRGYHNAVTIPLANAGIPLFPVPGNHDAAPTHRLPDRALYEQQWLDPAFRPKWPLYDPYRYPFSYTFVAGNALFVIIDAATGRVDSRDLAWLRRTLRASRSFDQVFAFAHVPFAPYLDRSYGTLRPIRPLYRLLARHAVRLFTGHYEVYFDGYFGDLRTVSCGQLSHTCRVPIGQQACQGMAFLVADFVRGRLRLVALRGPLFRSRFDPNALPLEVGSYWRWPILPAELARMLEAPFADGDLDSLGID